MQTERSWVQIPQGAERNGGEEGESFEAGVGVGVGVVVGVGVSHGTFGVGEWKELVVKNEFAIAPCDVNFWNIF